MSEKLKLFLKGIINILPLLIPVVPFGIILGAIGIELNFSPLEIFATSFIILEEHLKLFSTTFFKWRFVIDNY